MAAMTRSRMRNWSFKQLCQSATFNDFIFGLDPTEPSNERLCVIHFYHTNFRRCKIIDKHLAVSHRRVTGASTVSPTS